MKAILFFLLLNFWLFQLHFDFYLFQIGSPFYFHHRQLPHHVKYLHLHFLLRIIQRKGFLACYLTLSGSNL
uniref:Putative secreted protein n=1 Tax=Panstrongylus lignarius TaxID=156445 RepID=A0A224XUE5_9HEMI